MIIQEVNFRVSQLPVSEIHFVLRSVAALQRYIRTDSRLRQSFFKGHIPINRSFTFYEHWLYTGDKTFLREKVLPVMLSAVEFWKNRLVRDENDGKWICPREFSPRQGPTGKVTAHAQQLVKFLFSNTLKACKALDKDCPLRAEKLEVINDYHNNIDDGLYMEIVNKADGELLLKE